LLFAVLINQENLGGGDVFIGAWANLFLRSTLVWSASYGLSPLWLFIGLGNMPVIGPFFKALRLCAIEGEVKLATTQVL
jgi:hypothetical protein